MLKGLIDLVAGVIDRVDQLLVINKRTERDVKVGNATDGDIFKKTVGKEILLGL